MNYRPILTALLIAIPTLALAQDVQNATDPGQTVIGLICANQTMVGWALSALIAHTGLSITSATLKKLGLTSDNPWVKIVRLLAIDVKPPNAAIVQQAATILAASPGAVAATRVDPAKVAAAAKAL